MRIFIVEDRYRRVTVAAENQDQAVDFVVAKTGEDRKSYCVDEIPTDTAGIVYDEDIHFY